MTTVGKFLRTAVLGLLLLVAPAVASAQKPVPEGFVPVEQLPGQEGLPAAPLVAGAYGVAWVAVLIYVFSLWRRLAAVERELAAVARRLEAAGRR